MWMQCLRVTSQEIHVGHGQPWPTLLGWVVTGAQYVNSGNKAEVTQNIDY